MAKFKAIGSEKLEGVDKLKRIMEIATYKLSSTNINEGTSEYTINLADGMDYHIIKEKQGYIIKKGISESTLDYMDHMKNRKYFSSYSQALRKLNLIIKENNELNGQNDEIKLFGEQKKFVLKTPAPPEVEIPEPMVPSEPLALPEPELPMADMDDMDMEMDVDMDIETPVDTDKDMGQDTEEKVSFKLIQKLTGKLTQKMRALESQDGMSSEDIKYVVNMVLSAVDLSNLEDEDLEDIMSKFEDMDAESEMDIDMETDDSEVDMDFDMTDDEPMDGEMEEQGMFNPLRDMKKMNMGRNNSFSKSPRGDKNQFGGIGDFEMLDGDEFAEFREFMAMNVDNQELFGDKSSAMNMFKSDNGRNENPFRAKMKKAQMGEEEYNSEAYMKESKIDKVLSRYFEVSSSEINHSQTLFEERKDSSKSKLSSMINKVETLSETIEQELSGKKFLEENKSFEFIGKTNKKNLIFEGNNKQIKISVEGIVS